MAEKNLVFGLDIGTRSIVGSVGYLENNKFNVIAHYVKEHETRAMLDGQIHDIEKVAETIKLVKNNLEEQLNTKLTEVCIAAAGRVLKTRTVHSDYERNDDGPITNDEVYNVEMLAVEKAYESIRKEDPDVEYYCVGYSVIKYFVNDYVINVPEGHRGRKLSADVLSTFLPNDVVDGLYTAVGIAGLSVVNLTLEPIAAINIAIPEQFRLLNIALVDVGAGTSDISITKDGSIIAYGMIPHAGDEITETIARKCLVDFKTAEKIKLASVKNKSVSYKDIMGTGHKLMQADARELYEDTVDSMTKEIAERITELNGGKAVSAVFVVGGGGKAHGFTEKLSIYLGLSKERVALRGEEVLGDVIFHDPKIKKDPLLVTPIGICLNYYAKHNNFIFVNINDQRIKLYDNDKLTVLDAALQINFPNEALFPRRGKELNYTVNGVAKMLRGQPGEPAIIKINDITSDLNSRIIKNDVITIEESTKGPDASLTIDNIPEYKEKLTLNINGNMVVCPKFVEVNGQVVVGGYSIKDNDTVEILNYYTVSQLATFMDISLENIDVYVNNSIADKATKIYEQFVVEFKPHKASEDNSVSNISDISEAESYTIEGSYNTEFSPKEELQDNTENSATVSSQSIKLDTSKDTEKYPTVAAKEKVNNNSKDIIIIVNKEAVVLSGKASYIFVDILDFYPFDTRKPGGIDIVRTINGIPCEFTTPIHDNDIIELYWK